LRTVNNDGQEGNSTQEFVAQDSSACESNA
jgi:hypothetical protein